MAASSHSSYYCRYMSTGGSSAALISAHCCGGQLWYTVLMAMAVVVGIAAVQKKTKVAVSLYNNILTCSANKKVTVVAKVEQSNNWSQLLTPTMIAHKLGAQRNIHRLKRHQASEYIVAILMLVTCIACSLQN